MKKSIFKYFLLIGIISSNFVKAGNDDQLSVQTLIEIGNAYHKQSVSDDNNTLFFGFSQHGKSTLILLRNKEEMVVQKTGRFSYILKPTNPELSDQIGSGYESQTKDLKIFSNGDIDIPGAGGDHDFATTFQYYISLVNSLNGRKCKIVVVVNENSIMDEHAADLVSLFSIISSFFSEKINSYILAVTKSMIDEKSEVGMEVDKAVKFSKFFHPNAIIYFPYARSLGEGASYGESEKVISAINDLNLALSRFKPIEMFCFSNVEKMFSFQQRSLIQKSIEMLVNSEFENRVIKASSSFVGIKTWSNYAEALKQSLLQEQYCVFYKDKFYTSKKQTKLDPSTSKTTCTTFRFV